LKWRKIKEYPFFIFKGCRLRIPECDPNLPKIGTEIPVHAAYKFGRTAWCIEQPMGNQFGR
jgi:hypothetical protein